MRRWIVLCALGVAVAASCSSQPPPQAPTFVFPETTTKTTSSSRSRTALPAAASAEVPVQGRDFPAVADRSSHQALCSDGGDVLLLAGEKRLHRVTRSHRVTEMESVNKPEGCVALGTGDMSRFVVWGAAGEYATVTASEAHVALAPALDAEDLAGAIITSPARMMLFGKHRAMYTLEGDRWAVGRYPAGTNNVVFAGVDAKGKLYLLTAHGRILTSGPSGIQELSIAGIAAEQLNDKWVGGWLSPQTNSLWAFTEHWVVRIDLASQGASASQPDRYSRAGVGTGVHTPKGDLVVTGSYSSMYLYDGATYSRIDPSPCGRDAIVIDPQRSTLLCGNYDGLKRAAFRHPFLDTGAPPQPR